LGCQYSYAQGGKIVNAWGDTIAEASSDNKEVVYAEVSLEEARQKRVVFKPGEFEMDFIGDRRPEFYNEITTNKSRGAKVEQSAKMCNHHLYSDIAG